MPNKLVTKTKTATIAASASGSTAIELEDSLCYGVQIPTLTSGTLKVQGSLDEAATFQDIYDEFGNQVLVFPAGTGGFSIGKRAMEHAAGFSHIQFITGVTQGSARTITLYMRNTNS